MRPTASRSTSASEFHRIFGSGSLDTTAFAQCIRFSIGPRSFPTQRHESRRSSCPQFLTVPVFAFRESEGNLRQVARATKPERLLELIPASPAWMSWPPPITIDDEALDVLATRFVKVLGASIPRRVEV
jgi:hypothetical protein